MNDTLTKQTIHNILMYIKDNNLRSGDFLPTEAMMVEKLQVSRVIIREAYSYLKGLGLITSRRGSGFRIAEVDLVNVVKQVLDQLSYFGEGALNELLSLRRLMEIGAVYEAVENATSAELEEIAAAADHLEDIVEASELTVDQYNIAELRFHRAIMKPARSKMLEIINLALDRYFQSRNDDQSFPPPVLTKLAKDNQEHRQIAIAFARKQPQIALLALHEHFFHKKLG